MRTILIAAAALLTSTAAHACRPPAVGDLLKYNNGPVQEVIKSDNTCDMKVCTRPIGSTQPCRWSRALDERNDVIWVSSETRTCTGVLTDMRAIGVTLGDCDLNGIPDADFAYVKSQCGKPQTLNANGEVDETKTCSIRVLASPDKNSDERRSASYPVFKVLRGKR